MSELVDQKELRIYPTDSIGEVEENYTDNAEWCAPFSGDMLRYYRHEYPAYDSFPVGLYLV